MAETIDLTDAYIDAAAERAPERAAHRHLDLENLEAERDDLVAQIQSIECQLAQRKAAVEQFRRECLALGPSGRDLFYAEESRFLTWKARAMGAKRHLVRDLKDVKAQIKVANVDQVSAVATRRYQALRRAVRDHRAQTLAAGLDPTEADAALWGLLRNDAALDDMADTHG